MKSMSLVCIVQLLVLYIISLYTRCQQCKIREDKKEKERKGDNREIRCYLYCYFVYSSCQNHRLLVYSLVVSSIILEKRINIKRENEKREKDQVVVISLYSVVVSTTDHQSRCLKYKIRYEKKSVYVISLYIVVYLLPFIDDNNDNLFQVPGLLVIVMATSLWTIEEEKVYVIGLVSKTC